MKHIHHAWLAALTLPAIATAAIAGTVPTQTQTIQPGEWQITVTVTAIDMPGAPAGVAQSLRGQPRTITNCITAEQAARGPQEMIKAAPNCTISNYSMAGGKFSAEMRCNQAGGTMTARTAGTFTPTSFTTTSNATMSGRMAMRMTSTSTGRRVGACAGNPTSRKGI